MQNQNGILPLHRLIEFEKEDYARIGVMPRYGDAESVMWFDVEPLCMFHLINCFEEGAEVHSILQIVSLFHILVTGLNLIVFFLPSSHSEFHLSKLQFLFVAT